MTGGKLPRSSWCENVCDRREIPYGAARRSRDGRREIRFRLAPARRSTVENGEPYLWTPPIPDRTLAFDDAIQKLKTAGAGLRGRPLGHTHYLQPVLTRSQPP